MPYDIEMANGAGRPASIRIGQEMLPDATAEVLFQDRASLTCHHVIKPAFETNIRGRSPIS